MILIKFLRMLIVLFVFFKGHYLCLNINQVPQILTLDRIPYYLEVSRRLDTIQLVAYLGGGILVRLTQHTWEFHPTSNFFLNFHLFIFLMILCFLFYIQNKMHFFYLENLYFRWFSCLLYNIETLDSSIICRNK